MKNPKALVLTGDGINCERETARAFNFAGAEAKIVHINDLLANPGQMKSFEVIAFPGGFAFGDDLGSGQILALKIKSYLQDQLNEFVEQKKPVIGICNGFQALVKLGLLPTPLEERTVAIAKNVNGEFIDCWVDMEMDEHSPCIWTRFLKGVNDIKMPIRHGEGRIAFLRGEEEKIHTDLSKAGQIPLRYKEDINGSFGRIAALCDPKGLIFGMMPHPEAAISKLLHPHSSLMSDRKEKGVGLSLFKSCVHYLKES